MHDKNASIRVQMCVWNTKKGERVTGSRGRKRGPRMIALQVSVREVNFPQGAGDTSNKYRFCVDKLVLCTWIKKRASELGLIHLACNMYLPCM